VAVVEHSAIEQTQGSHSRTAKGIIRNQINARIALLCGCNGGDCCILNV